jgi:predicted metal-dependent enzyme (double-stranded beta helix superfamily)
MTANQPATEIKPTTGPSELVTAVRGVVHAGAGWLQTAQLAAGQLSRHLPGPGLLTAGQRAGDPARHCTHTLHVEPDGSFSVVALVWRPGQATRIHDHITWCAFAVIAGVEHEEVFDARLRRIGEHTNYPGDAQALTPPGDIHRVRNAGAITAISLHIYGTDVCRTGSSVHRYYD